MQKGVIMRLFNEEEFDRLCERGSPENHGRDWMPVKLVLRGTGCAWLLSEIVQSNNQFYGYGVSDFGRGDILEGFIDLSMLELMSDPLQTCHVEQDTDFVPQHGISVYQTAARMNGCITEDADALKEALDYLENAEALTIHKNKWMPQPQP